MVSMGNTYREDLRELFIYLYLFSFTIFFAFVIDREQDYTGPVGTLFELSSLSGFLHTVFSKSIFVCISMC